MWFEGGRLKAIVWIIENMRRHNAFETREIWGLPENGYESPFLGLRLQLKPRGIFTRTATSAFAFSFYLYHPILQNANIMCEHHHLLLQTPLLMFDANADVASERKYEWTSVQILLNSLTVVSWFDIGLNKKHFKQEIQYILTCFSLLLSSIRCLWFDTSALYQHSPQQKWRGRHNQVVRYLLVLRSLAWDQRSTHLCAVFKENIVDHSIRKAVLCYFSELPCTKFLMTLTITGFLRGCINNLPILRKSQECRVVPSTLRSKHGNSW